MTSVHRVTVALKRHLLAVFAASMILLVGAPASAQGHLVWPEFGFGAGSFAQDGLAQTALQFDFSVGWEQEGYPWSTGALLRLDLLLFSPDNEVFTDVRFDIAPLLTYSSTYETTYPFFRAGAGPLLTFSEFGAVGLGAHGELAVGFKSIVDLYVDAKASVDALGPSIGLTAGIRLNAFIFDRFYHVYYY